MLMILTGVRTSNTFKAIETTNNFNCLYRQKGECLNKLYSCKSHTNNKTLLCLVVFHYYICINYSEHVTTTSLSWLLHSPEY